MCQTIKLCLSHRTAKLSADLLFCCSLFRIGFGLKATYAEYLLDIFKNIETSRNESSFINKNKYILHISQVIVYDIFLMLY